MTTIKLMAPARKGEREITELNFADPKVKHILAVDRLDPDSAAAVVALTAALTGEPESLIQELGPEDYCAVRTHVMPMYAKFVGVDLAVIAQSALKAADTEKIKDNPTSATDRMN